MQTTSRNWDGQKGTRQLWLSELPATLLDALLVANKLGISYIWIDSPCIIQDDPQDLVTELASMPRIYKEASLTVVAANSERCTDGFLHPREPRQHPAFRDPVRSQCRNQVGGVAHIILYRTESNEPIIHRAWTLQEQYHSPRMLIYNAAIMTWTCSSRRYADDAPLAIAHGYKNEDDFTNLSKTFYGPDLTEMKALEQWQAIIHQYANRQLSVQADKLRALAAVAEEFRMRTGWLYAAGLWVE
jgi:hypothetical protein